MNQLKILFIIDRIGTMEYFSIPILSSLAKRDGHQVKLIKFCPNQKKACKKIISYKPDIIAYSVCSNEAKRYLEINNILKKRFDFFSLFGGPHPTFFPTFIKEDGIDGICRGEADHAFPEFLKDFGKDCMYKKKNFSFKLDGDEEIIENPLMDLVDDLDTLPFPDRDILYSQGYFLARTPIKTFMAARGCPFNCSYCFNHVFNTMYKGKGKIMRTKSVDYFINEIKDIRKRYPLAFIKFHDDIFGADRGWLNEFAEKYPKEVGLPFLCLSRPNMLRDEYCSQLKKAGCHSVELAIECGNENIRNIILNRHLTDQEIIEGCKRLRSAGIRIYSLNMVGLPSETYQDMLATINLNQKIEADFTDASIFQPYPRTNITEYCKKYHYLKEGLERFESQFSTSVLDLDRESKNRIYVLHRLFAFLVDHPKLKRILPVLFRMNKIPLMKNVFNYFYRFYYGFNLHKRIFASKIPMSICIRGALITLFSKNRT